MTPTPSEIAGLEAMMDKAREIVRARERLNDAAPAMLEACQLMAHAHDAWREVVQYMNARGDAAPAAIALAMEKARAAIKQATGE